MIPAAEPADPGAPSARHETRRFARRLLAAMGVIVAGLCLVGIFLARRQLQDAQAGEAARGFASEFAAIRALQKLRIETLAAHAAALADQPRIHAALEDDALDLLYLAAHDELLDLFPPASASPEISDQAPASSPARGGAGRVRFYRFLDASGRLIPPDPPAVAGDASPAELAALAPPGLGDRLAHGFALWSTPDAAARATELLALPIHSHADGRRIGYLVLGFDPAPELLPVAGASSGPALMALWSAGKQGQQGQLHAPGLSAPARAELARALASHADGPDEVRLDGRPHRLARRLLNPDQAYPPVEEIRLSPLDDLRARQRFVTWQITAAGAFILLAGIGVSGLLTAGFSDWFGRFARDSEAQRALRVEAEARLDQTAAELDRAARFAADASHQLKTPVAVLRVGLQELSAVPGSSAAQRGEIEELVRQTDRLAHILETLLLLSKLDAGLMRPRFATVDLAELAAAALDDLGVLPAAENLVLENTLDAPLLVRGEARQLALVLQNLLENAAKYNRPSGLVRISVETDAREVRLLVANTAPTPVPPGLRERIFERFHRGAAAGDVPGYGLGLNLARHLARLHGGELRVLRSDERLTVFALTLPKV